MPLPVRILAALCLLLCQACSHLVPPAPDIRPRAHEFHFGDGGRAGYFVLDKSADPTNPPTTFLFMIPGSDCGSMGGVLPAYFDGLDGRAGGTRVFILHKRFIGTGANGNCSDDFTRADHPLRWLADQEEFIRTELAAARTNGQALVRIAIAGMSEGAEIAPALARRIPDVTHVALLANGGMNPFDAYRLQMQRHGFHHALADIEHLCPAPSDAIIAAERTCRYWNELQAIQHTDNLLALDVPIFIAMGEADTMVPVESAWFIQDKFATQGKKNLHLLTIPGASHDFRRNGESVLPYLWDALEHWLHQ
ncbi:MAG TPA: prolyl oligopeptidase family serine peptidase [Noviherbaspirillum sp.]|nr:prolyl oligopeptidase family serine peptidase [Noviherbaspirillum sp.]